MNFFWLTTIKLACIALLLSPSVHSVVHNSSVVSTQSSDLKVSLDVDYAEFLKQQDLVWDRLPDSWPVAPFSGNGNIGFLFYQSQSDKDNSISLHVGRHDYYDHRLPHDGKEMPWIYRGRLPLGHFKLTSIGKITDVDLRLSLWDAELTGTISTSRGSYSVRGLTHSQRDIIYFETDAKDGESITISWHPDVPFPSVRAFLDDGIGPKSSYWDEMRTAPMPMPPAATEIESDGFTFSFQPLYQHRGETTTGWEVTGKADGQQALYASIHHSFPEKNSLQTVKENLQKARKTVQNEQFISSHQQWWHNYYPQSYLSISEPEKQAFYWIQMYKLASANRGNGPLLDLMGPWYHKTFWPMVWGDLNVQLIYWTHLTANRMSLGDSLINNINKYATNLTKNVPVDWKDSAAVGALFPQDMVSDNARKVPDMLAWLLHDYWLHCEYLADDNCMRDGLFPILRKTVNSYRNYLDENPVPSKSGTIHIKHSWSPEYKPGHGQDINFTIGLMRWSLQTLIDLNQNYDIQDPLADEWQHILDNIVGFQIDENGLRIGKDIPFSKPHRHYSHLLPFYPLAVITPEKPENKQLLRTSVDHWLETSMNKNIKIDAMPVTGYTATGATSIYAMLGDSVKAYQYLDYFIQHQNVSPTTMYSESRNYPVIESPLSYATSVHDMLLQSWGGKIRVFPASPAHWQELAFYQLRTQGAFLVSASKQQGITQFVEVQSLAGKPLVIQTDIDNPKIYIQGKLANETQAFRDDSGFYQIKLSKGERAILTKANIENTALSIKPTPINPEEWNMFGLNEKTKRLPGHHYYYKR
ncbi:MULTISPECIES: glycosyl hydrolase family 95 catalytic domain-containing protein [Aliiglaciecola]|uniref:glycosyl hydrolase family 95 catalytic domain-containing protein n=1 Tax=Aliiglaciecola TaxID=1406885 RepID=UPI001C0A3B6F|nr:MULTISPECIES: hypothetical protein [Aliiglaciecola]MBU2877945.1 hypothetical protein [Aliiglaciecola lipolytica]MDO6709310.1 hypothetical protein [Aliiglaciecola sp. 2_MG-2023]MDO6750458.1 hypothetical protein [Aliiglaciecola sp. 1_MG-2023]